MQGKNVWHFRFAGIALTLAFSALSAYAGTAATTNPSSAKTSSHHSLRRASHHHKHVAKSHGQQKIDSERAQQIQEALIREHYLDGQASGVWDDASQHAMQRFQSSNGWQAKVVPDSRALIKLGLGPDHEHLLNPESAMTTPPQLTPRSAAPEQSKQK